jgi:hypothetical protein
MSQYTLACARTLRRDALLSIALLTLGFSVLTLAVAAQSAHAASDETVGDTFPASLTPTGEFAESGTGETPSISADGRYVAFLSAAENLGEEGPPGVREAYVKDLHTGALELVSRASGVAGEPASEPVEDLVIAGDGRYAIFASTAPNLREGIIAEAGLHVYRRDLQTGETALVDRVSGVKGAIVTREASAEAISADGRYVVFSADVEDLEDPTGAHTVTGGYTLYVRDMQTATTTTVGRASGAGGAIADEPSIASSISPDGRYVAFESAATNLVPGMTANTVSQVYLRDRQTDTTTLVSKTAPSGGAPAGEPGNASSEGGTLIGTDGCEVAFDSEASNLYRFEEQPVATPEVYLTDLCATPLHTTLVSRADGETGAPAGEGNTTTPRLFGASADGRYILFSALASLLGETSNHPTHLYLRDLETGHTTLVDRASGPAGEAANSNPKGGAIAANDCRVVFATDATNLSAPEPPNAQRETYVRQLAACNEEPTVAPTSLAFGTQALDTIGAGQQVTVTAGSEALSITRVQPTGADAADFILTEDECTGETLQPDGQCTLFVRFAPAAAGPRSASLVVHAAGEARLEIALSGEGGQLPAGSPGEGGKEGAAGAPGEGGKTGAPGEPGKAGARGPRGPRGARGTKGATGARGGKGATGARGGKGAQGARGRAGRDAKAACRLTKSRRKLICLVTLVGRNAANSTRAKLTKNGHTYARGSLGGLYLTRTIRRGSYTLRLAVDGDTWAIPVRLSPRPTGRAPGARPVLSSRSSVSAIDPRLRSWRYANGDQAVS